MNDLSHEENARLIQIQVLKTTERTPQQIAEQMLEKPTFVHILSDGSSKALNIEVLRQYAQKLFGTNFIFTYDGDILKYYAKADEPIKQKTIEILVRAKLWATSGLSDRSRSTAKFEIISSLKGSAASAASRSLRHLRSAASRPRYSLRARFCNCSVIAFSHLSG